MTRVMQMIRAILWLIIIVFLVDFAVGNRAEVVVLLRALRLGIPMPVYMIFFAGIVFGLLLAGIETGAWRVRRFFETRSLERHMAELTAENDQLREAAHGAQAAEHQDQARER